MSLDRLKLAIQSSKNNSNGSDAEPDPLNMSLDSIGSKRGRPLIQDQWTRIIHVTDDTDSWAKVYVIATELLLENHLPQVSR